MKAKTKKMMTWGGIIAGVLVGGIVFYKWNQKSERFPFLLPKDPPIDTLDRRGTTLRPPASPGGPVVRAPKQPPPITTYTKAVREIGIKAPPSISTSFT